MWSADFHLAITMSQFTLLDIIRCQNILGEGVQWNHRDQSVWWTDILGSKLYRYQPVTQDLQVWNTPDRVSCFAFVEDHSRLLLALASGFAWFDLLTGHYDWIAQPESGLPGNRLNDGRVDRQGRFWVGSLVEEPQSEHQQAALYCLDHGQRVKQHLSGLKISNSLCWSPDSSKLYHADSPSHSIRVYDFDPESGSLTNPGIFATLPDGMEPDGACVDAQGYLWSAQWGGSRVVRYAPDGRVDRLLELPVSQPTCVALGGKDMNWLLITSARKGLSKQALAAQPEAGSLFIYHTDVQGLPENWYIAD